jgi:hypothetical protein
MPTELLVALIAKYGIPLALQIMDVVKNQPVVTPEMLARLAELGARTAADYERAPQS